MNWRRNVAVTFCLGSLLNAMVAQADVSIGPDVIITGNEVKVLRPGPDLRAIMKDIVENGSPAVDNPYLIRLGPGVYTITPNLDGNGLVMAPYISIAGSGQGITLLNGEIPATNPFFPAIVTGASNTVLTDLSVENTSGNETSIAIYNKDVIATRLERVTATVSGSATQNYGILNSGSSPTMIHFTGIASGGSNNYGVRNRDSSSPEMIQVTGIAFGGTGSANWGVRNTNSSSPTMTQVTATASGGDFSAGVDNWDFGSAIMTQVTATATDGTVNIGVRTQDDTSPTMTQVTATASGGTTNYGLDSGFASPRIESSFFSGSTAALSLSSSEGARISNTQLVGGIMFDPVGTQCRETYDENLADVTC